MPQNPANQAKSFHSIHLGRMEQIVLAFGIPKETVTSILKYMKVKVHLLDGDTDFFHIFTGVL